MRTRPGSPQALPYAAPYAARFEARAIAHLWRRRPAGEASAAGTRSAGPRWMTSACGGGGERVGGRSKARHSAVTAAGFARLSPLDVQCVFIKNQYRSVLIGSSSPREGACVRAGVCVCGWGVGMWECGGVGVWGRGNKEAHLTNASLSSVGGLGPPKPPLTRHLVSSSERARQCDAARTRANARQAGRQGWRESVLSIHDPWCYTLSCNTCN